MKTREHWQGVVAFAVMLLVGIGLCIPSAMAVYMKNLSIEEMVKKADVICIGKVAKKESRWVSGHIETTMAINVSEYLKGNIGNVVEITQVGGVLKEPIPIAQYVTGMPEFYKNEEVLLFLSTQKRSLAFTPAKAPSPKSRLLNSPQVVGLAQGKYTIVTDPDTGEKRVTHFRLDNLAILSDGKIADKAFEAMTQPAELPAKEPQNPLATIPKSRIGAMARAGQLPLSSPSSSQQPVIPLREKSDSQTQDAQLNPRAAPEKSLIMPLGKDVPTRQQVSSFRSQAVEPQAIEIPANEQAVPPALRFSKLKTLNEFKTEIETILGQ